MLALFAASGWVAAQYAPRHASKVESSQVAEQAMNWEEAQALALRHNPDLSASRLAAEGARASYHGSFNLLLPQLSLSHGVGDSDGSTGSSRWDAQASLGMSLLDLNRVASIRRSAANLDRAAASLRTASANARFSLRRAFLQLLLTQENAGVSQRVAEIRRRGSELVSLRYNAGRESQGNMLRANAQALQAEADLAQSDRDLRTARRNLGRQLGLERFVALVATGTLPSNEPPELPSDEAELLSRRPEVTAQEAQVRSGEAGLLAARSALAPSLSGRYSRSVAGPWEFPSSRTNWSALATLSLPLLAGGPTAAYHEIRTARMDLERSRQDLRAARSQALLDIETAWSDFARTAAQTRVQAALLAAARQRSQEADIRYASGLLSFDNWEIITSDRVAQERQALQARLECAVAEANWERALGIGFKE